MFSFLIAVILWGSAAPALADSIQAAAARAAADIWERMDRLQADVTRIDADRRRVYLSGFPAGLIDTGARVRLYRKSSSAQQSEEPDGESSWVEFGSGEVWTVADHSVCVLVGRDLIRRIPRRFAVGRPDPRGVNLRIDAFASVPTEAMVDAPARVFRGMMIYEFRSRGNVPSAAGGLVLRGEIWRASETNAIARVGLVSSVDSMPFFSGEYFVDLDPAVLSMEREPPPQDGMQSAASESEEPPPGLVRLSLMAPPAVPGEFQIHSVSPSGMVFVRDRSAPAEFSECDTIVATVDTDPAQRLAKFELGETDFYELSDAEFSRYTGSVDYLNRIVRSPSAELFTLIFNLSAYPASRLDFRFALEKAFDRRAALEVLLNHRGVQANGFSGPPSGVVSSAHRKSTAESRAARARRSSSAGQLLKSIVRPASVSILIPEEDPAFGTIAEKIRADLKPFTIAVNIIRHPWAAYEERLRSGAFDLALVAWPFPRAEREWLTDRFASGGSDNFGFYRSLAFDALMSENGDDESARELLKMDLPALPLFWLHRYAVISPRLSAMRFPPEFLFSFQSHPGPRAR